MGSFFKRIRKAGNRVVNQSIKPFKPIFSKDVARELRRPILWERSFAMTGEAAITGGALATAIGLPELGIPLAAAGLVNKGISAGIHAGRTGDFEAGIKSGELIAKGVQKGTS